MGKKVPPNTVMNIVMNTAPQVAWSSVRAAVAMTSAIALAAMETTRASTALCASATGPAIRSTTNASTRRTTVWSMPRLTPARNFPAKSCPVLSCVVSSRSSVPLRRSSMSVWALRVTEKSRNMTMTPGSRRSRMFSSSACSLSV